MKALEPPDTHHLSAALGWLGLGAPAEARAELARVSPGLEKHPDVLEVRWALCSEDKNWPEGLQVARDLIQAAPERAAGWIFQAYALRRVPEGGLPRAWEALLPAFERFPREAIIPFNLSCYACQMGQLEPARSWLARAAQIGGRPVIRQMALAEPDLEPLWGEIGRWGVS